MDTGDKKHDNYGGRIAFIKRLFRLGVYRTEVNRIIYGLILGVTGGYIVHVQITADSRLEVALFAFMAYSTVVLVFVVWHTIQVYNEIQDGRQPEEIAQIES